MTSLTSSSIPIITLRRSDDYVTADPLQPNIVMQLATVRHTLGKGGGGCRIVRERDLLAQIDPICKQDARGCRIPRPWFPIGLVPVIEHLLQSNDAGSRRIGRWPSSLAAPMAEHVQRHGNVNNALLDLIQHQDRGQIRYGRRSDIAWIIAQIALAWPSLSIVVAIATRKEVFRLTGELKQWLFGDVTAVTADRDGPQRHRIAVATYPALHNFSVGIAQRHIFIAVDAGHILGKDGRRGLREAFNCRQYGMLPAGIEQAPLDSDEQRAIFGFHELTVLSGGQLSPKVEVAWVPICGGPKLASGVGSSGPGMHHDDEQLAHVARHGIWEHPVRNRRIAKLAKMLYTGGHERLQQDFPAVAGAVQLNRIPRLGILVETIEHALALSERLPGFSLVAADDVNVNGLSSHQRVVFGQAKAVERQSSPCIITGAGIDHVQFAEFDVVINATGSAGPALTLASPTRPSKSRASNCPAASTGFLAPGCKPAAPMGPAPPPVSFPAVRDYHLQVGSSERPKVLVVDFADRHHASLRISTRRRREAYAAAGWYSPGADPVEERVKVWLAKRPPIRP